MSGHISYEKYLALSKPVREIPVGHYGYQADPFKLVKCDKCGNVKCRVPGCVCSECIASLAERLKEE